MGGLIEQITPTCTDACSSLATAELAVRRRPPGPSPRAFSSTSDALGRLQTWLSAAVPGGNPPGLPQARRPPFPPKSRRELGRPRSIKHPPAGVPDVTAARAADHLWMHFARQGLHPERPIPVVT